MPVPVARVGQGRPHPADMVRVSGGPFLFKAEHRDREGACYDDVETWDRYDSDGQDWEPAPLGYGRSILRAR